MRWPKSFLNGSGSMISFSIVVLVFLNSVLIQAQTKVRGYIQDSEGARIPYATVQFSNSHQGTTSDENGFFYMEATNSYSSLVVSFMGYETQTVMLPSRISEALVVVLVPEAAALDEVVIYQGKTSKKDNPAVTILQRIWKNRRENGVQKFKHYAYDKYEKLEFDLNSIDSTFMKRRVFKGMEFVFDYADTSKVTGKTFLPIFINEALYKVHGESKKGLHKEVLRANKNSGLSNNQSIIASIQELYADFDIYDNYLKFFEKSFVSPLATTAVNTYNYVLTDSAYIDQKWCYNIRFYPRRKNELTFKGDFWVNDSTWAIKEIHLQMSRSANINWVKDVYIEQEFEVLNDSVFLMTRDYFQSDFALNKKEDSRGIYGKRTTIYDNYNFQKSKAASFYTTRVDPFHSEVYNQSDDYWRQHRLEDLNKNERHVYNMLDTLKTVRAFNQMYNFSNILATGYIRMTPFDYGPVLSTVGYNVIEGLRLRIGGRTFITPNDQWRFEGYTAYGVKDDRFKYGLSAKWLIDRKTRLTLAGGNRRDIEQLGVSLSNTNDVQGRSQASSAVVTTGDNRRLTNINLTALSFSIEPIKNLEVAFQGSYRTLESASPFFRLDYFEDLDRKTIASRIQQTELKTMLTFTPRRVVSGYGVEQRVINKKNHPVLILSHTAGVKGFLESDFEYQKLQFYCRQPWNIGGLGFMLSTFEVGKTFGAVPLGLLSVVPGNQTYFSIYNTFPLLNFYEFVTDTYSSLQLEHNFGGRILSKIPILRELHLREVISFRGIWGQLSDENRALDATGFLAQLAVPDNQVYWSWSAGVGNIFRILRVDFHFRGNYFDQPDARRFGVTGTFGIDF